MRTITRWLTLSTMLLLRGIPIVGVACVATRSFWPVSACSVLAAGIMLAEIFLTRREPVERKPTWVPPPVWDDGSRWVETRTADGAIVYENSDAPLPLPRTSTARDAEVAFLRQRLDEEMRAKWQAQERELSGPASARLVGRVARIDTRSEEAKTRTLWLAVEDEDGGHQAIRIAAEAMEVSTLHVGDLVTIACGWRRGHLHLSEVERREAMETPLPEVKLPDAKVKAEAAGKDGRLPTMDELDAEARKGAWGSLNHSIYRCPVPFHLTTSPKYRAQAFEGRAAEVQAILREVAEAEGLQVIALAAEADHVHLLGVPAGKGGMAPTWQWSRWVGRWKALTSRRLKSLPGLETFEWQTGYALTSVNGDRQGAEEALDVVKRYVEAQGHQEGGVADVEQ